MALGGSRPYHSPYCSPHRNPFSTDLVEDELARNPGPVRGSHSRSTSPAPSWNPAPGPDQITTLILASALALASTNELFKKFMKAYLESNQRLKQSSAEYEQPLKAKVPEVYHNKLHMDCYHFCPQCKDHFETIGATGTNRTSFTAFFLCGNISMHWT